MIYGFLRENWNIVKWVALGIVIFEVSEDCYDWHLEKRKAILFCGHACVLVHVPTENSAGSTAKQLLLQRMLIAKN